VLCRREGEEVLCRREGEEVLCRREGEEVMCRREGEDGQTRLEVVSAAMPTLLREAGRNGKPGKRMLREERRLPCHSHTGGGARAERGAVTSLPFAYGWVSAC
jgi:hypothetical protein